MSETKIPPLPTPETNREHIERLYGILNTIIEDLADIKQKLKST